MNGALSPIISLIVFAKKSPHRTASGPLSLQASIVFGHARRTHCENHVPSTLNLLLTSRNMVTSFFCDDSYSCLRVDLRSTGSSYACRNNLSREGKEFTKFLEPSEKPKAIHTDNSLEFGKPCEDLSWNRRKSTPYLSDTNGIVERAVRRVKERTSAVLLQSGLDEMVEGFFDMSKTSWQTGKLVKKGDSENHSRVEMSRDLRRNRDSSLGRTWRRRLRVRWRGGNENRRVSCERV